MRKLLLLAPVLLLASCHSAQVALRPQAATAEPLTASAPTLPLDSTLAATVVATRPTTVAVATSAPPTPRLSPPQRPHRVSVLRPLSRLVTASIAAPAARQLAHRIQRPRPTEGVAENGLGRVALFFIGVVLAVLAGLAALVSLIPGISFWGGLGLAAAGLIVIFLLYSLFSGGKKKK
jgi:small-conductance mechanosensitive channel